jgi:hypothetical protein
MKRISILLALVVSLAACGNNNDNTTNEKHDEGSEQVQGPVLNSGPETERDRANDAVRDTSLTSDSSASNR